jgi:hypothetical protein
MAKSSEKKKRGGPKKKTRDAKVTKAMPAARPMIDDDLSAALDVTGEALEMIGRIAAEAAGRLRALAEVHRRRTATDGEE